MASLKLSGVDKVYPSGTMALYDINLETRDKEFLVIVGGEESGKSTLLKVIAGLEDSSSGEIYIDDKEVSELEPKDRDIAMVFRSNTLYPALTVFDNMGFGLKLRKAPNALIEQRVKAAANILGLNDILFRKPKALTAAQKQRVTIGRAIVREPKLYLFDEPLSGLDEKLQAEILNVIINLQARMEGTFIYCTKNVAEAMTIGTRILVLKNGFVQQIDTPANLYDYPANAYVAFTLGAPTINFINKAQVVKKGGKVYAALDGFEVELSEKVLKRFEKLDEYTDTDKRVIVGIRPEDIHTGKTGTEAVLGKVESDGNAYYAEAEVGGKTLIVTTDEKAEKGAKTKLDIDLDRVYLFDADTRLTLLARDEGYKKTDFADADYVPLDYNEEEELKKKFNPKKDDKKKKLR
ncbi:MAG: ABC transporter ATP-binding protein [Clostridia bacterium]|nr:ABC transporter ATP-binding protein [Clostridia bacterium]